MAEARILKPKARGNRGMIGLFVGAGYPLRALTALNRTPRLWRYVLIPILVNIVVGVTLYLGMLLAGLHAIDAFVAAVPPWAAVLGVVLRVFLIIAVLLVTGFTLVRFGVVLGAPWYAKLSEQLELERTGQTLESRSGASDLVRAVLFELQKLLLVVVVALVLLLLNAVPVAGSLISVAGWIALGVIVACLDFLDAPLERRRLSFRAKLAVVRRAFPASAGFGLVCLGLISIPFINLLAIPLCVTAGTLFFCDLIWPDL